MRKFFVLTSVLFYLFIFVGSAFAQTGTVTATVRPNPLKVKIAAPSTVTVGQWFNISAEITNLSDDPITRTIVMLNSPSEIKVKAPRKRINTLNAHQTTTVNWQAKANASGNFVIQVEASGKLFGEPISSSDTTTITATGSLGALLFRLIFGA